MKRDAYLSPEADPPIAKDAQPLNGLSANLVFVTCVLGRLVLPKELAFALPLQISGTLLEGYTTIS